MTCTRGKTFKAVKCTYDEENLSFKQNEREGTERRKEAFAKWKDVAKTWNGTIIT